MFYSRRLVLSVLVRKSFRSVQTISSLLEHTKHKLNELVQSKLISSTDLTNIHINFATKVNTEYFVGDSLISLSKQTSKSVASAATNAAEVISEIKNIRKKRIQELKKRQSISDARLEELRGLGMKWFELGAANRCPISICALGM